MEEQASPPCSNQASSGWTDRWGLAGRCCKADTWRGSAGKGHGTWRV